MGLTFFVLAYVELFNGGANLPGGPITEFVGAVGNVWYPQWKLIAWYGCHCLVLCFLTCWVLINMDADRRKIRHGLLVSLWLAVFFAVPFWKQVAAGLGF